MATKFQLLQQLPEELLQEVLDSVGSAGLRRFQFTSRWCYEKAAEWLWREVELVDCPTERNERGVERDDHDDTPIVKKLVLLATRPDLACHVQVLTHRCHLPSPAIFFELPRCPLSSQTLTTDPRTIRLAELAVGNMTHLSTLRIIFGHPSLNDALIRSAFNRHRQKNHPLKRLWLECCRISAGLCTPLAEHPYGLPLELDFAGLESVRFRRLPFSVPAEQAHHPELYARSNQLWDVRDGRGGQYSTTMHRSFEESIVEESHEIWLHTAMAERPNDNRTCEPSREELKRWPHQFHESSPLQQLYFVANHSDDLIYESLDSQLTPNEKAVIAERHVLSHLQRSVLAYRGSQLDPLAGPPHNIHGVAQREKIPSSLAATNMLAHCTQTLTSLSLDWVFTMPAELDHTVLKGRMEHDRWIGLFIDLFSLRFPHLRAFQFRNALVMETRVLPGLYLLDHARSPAPSDLMPDEDIGDFARTAHQQAQLDTLCLCFMEAHPKLQCLAWPMDRFFADDALPSAIDARVEAVLENLSRNLIDLRVEDLYDGVSDLQSENDQGPEPASRDRRRRFISGFAAKMKSVESIKIEGGIPRDERRETLRALHACPLKKIVMIGTSCPLGNTWGVDGKDLSESLSPDESEALEAEFTDAMWRYGTEKPEPAGSDFRFQASYGWPPSPPMLHTLASFHAATVTELKFCGYKGAPALLSPTPITIPMLAALKHFTNLRTCVLSLWLCTRFEDEARDMEIIDYWLNTRSPSSKALVRVTDDEPVGWEKELREKYAPDALARRITGFIGPFLSEEAKGREGGVHVRGSFCVGDWGGIFDVDLRIGKEGKGGGDVCLGFLGPREELETGRRVEKLEGRRWF